MIAKLERPVAGNTSACAYKNLHNLPHWHREHEVIFVSSAAVELTASNKLYVLRPGAAAFIESDTVHFIKGSCGSVTSVIKTAAPATFSITEETQLVCPILEGRYDLFQYFNEIKQEQQSQQAYGPIIADSMATKLVAEIFRNEKTCVKAQQMQNQKQKELLEWILCNVSHVTFEDAARYMNFSKPYFSKYFQSFSGMKFTQYVNTLRVYAAIEKIAEGKMTMTEISIACGFGSIRNFNRIFKNYTGYTPRALPQHAIFSYRQLGREDLGFDPTLDCSEEIS